MSCYNLTLVHRATQEKHVIFAWDDYFGRHVYGYKLPNGSILTDDELSVLYEPTDFTEEVMPLLQMFEGAQKTLKALSNVTNVELICWHDEINAHQVYNMTIQFLPDEWLQVGCVDGDHWSEAQHQELLYRIPEELAKIIERVKNSK